MNRNEVKEVYLKVCDLYPNFRPKDPQGTFNIWSAHLDKYDKKEVLQALDDFIETNTSGYAPNLSNLIPKRNPGQFKGRTYTHEDFLELERAALQAVDHDVRI